MRDWCRANGIRQTMGPPHTPQLNGVAERYNRTLLDRLKPSLKQSSLNRQYWSDALSYAVWTTNRSPTRTNHGHKTPIEVYTGREPSMRHAHVFGAKGVYLIPAANRDKLDNHSRECRFIGVLPHGDGVKVIDSVSGKIVKTRDAVIDDESLPDSMVGINPTSPSSLDVDHLPWLYPDSQKTHQEQEEPVHQPEIQIHH